MEILFVSHKFPPATGGMEKQSFELITGMKKLTKVHSIVYEGKGSRSYFFWTLNKRIRKMLDENPKISIIHFNDGLIAAFSLLHRNYKPLKRIVTLHGLDVVFPSYLYQRFIFPRFNRFDLIIAVSSATANACEIRGIPSEKITVIHNGVDDASVNTVSREELDHLLWQKYQVQSIGKRILLTIGRPVKRKGFSWFIEYVMPLLSADFILLMVGPVAKKKSRFSLFGVFSGAWMPDFSLSSAPLISMRRKVELFLGAPDDEYPIECLMKKGNCGNINRLGKLPLEDIQAIMGVADAFIMPNIEVEGDMEGFGLVCLEASICGTKVFASASGGITDAITHGKNGILLPPGDAVAWANSLNQLIDDPDLSPLNPDEISSFTRKHFSWKKMCAEYLFHFYRISD